MRDSRRFILDHEFYCTRCGNKGISVVRDKKRSREKGHLKKLYCLTCKEEVNHVECSMALGYTYETFFDEYVSGNFAEDGTRVLPFKEWMHNRKIAESSESDNEVEDEIDVEDWMEFFGGRDAV